MVQQHAMQLRQTTFCLVVMNAMRNALETLTCDDTPQADYARRVFIEQYTQQASQAMEVGTITISPEYEAGLAELLPRTRMFILEMLYRTQQDHSPE